MQWPRDADEDVHILIRSARSLLTVMTRVMVAGMAGDLIVERDSITTSDVTADIATATATSTVLVVGIVSAAIVTGNTIDGVV